MSIRPQHYQNGSIEPIDYILSNNLGFCEGNVIKYVSRWKYKNGIEDLRKAMTYLEFLINEVESKKEVTNYSNSNDIVPDDIWNELLDNSVQLLVEDDYYRESNKREY